MERFSRSSYLLGPGAVETLHRSSVTIFGAGAVGSFAAEALTRSGIGAITIVDFDRISLSNINRQLYALETTIGLYKVDVAEERCRQINPACRVVTHKVFADQTSIPSILKPEPDIVIDAIDSIGPKVDLLSYCKNAGIPVISSMGAARRLDPLSVRTGDIFETSGCPLARRMRKMLRRNGIESGIPCVYSTEPPSEPVNGYLPEVTNSGTGGGEKILGSLPTVTGVFGLVIADLAVKSILKTQNGNGA